MSDGSLGRTYQEGEVIFRQGEVGERMYVIQSGQVEVLREVGDEGVRLALLGAGDFFGEMAVFDREVRSATVRALGRARLLTVDKKTFLRRITEDPSLAFRVVQKMSQRIRELDSEVAAVKTRAPGGGM